MTDAELVFWAAIVGHVAWPALWLTLVLLFRKPLKTFVANIAELEGFGWKASIRRKIEELSESAAQADSDTPGPEEAAAAYPPPRSEALPSPAAPADNPDGSSPSNVVIKRPKKIRFQSMTVTLSPEEIVMRGWDRIDHELRQAAAPVMGLASLQAPTMALATALANAGRISPHLHVLIMSAEAVATQAATVRPSKLDFTQAMSFSATADSIAKAIVDQASAEKWPDTPVADGDG